MELVVKLFAEEVAVMKNPFKRKVEKKNVWAPKHAISENNKSGQYDRPEKIVPIISNDIVGDTSS